MNTSIQWLLETYYPSYARALQTAGQQSKWLCWHYELDEWQHFDQEAWQHDLRRVRSILMWGILFVGVVCIGSIVAMPHVTTSLPELAFVLLATGCAIATVAVFARITYTRSRDAHQARLQGPPEIYIGPLAVFLPGQILPLGGYSAHPPLNFWDPLLGGIDVLQDVGTTEGNPLCVYFRGRRIYGRGGLAWRVTVEIPVPTGRDSEAA